MSPLASEILFRTGFARGGARVACSTPPPRRPRSWPRPFIQANHIVAPPDHHRPIVGGARGQRRGGDSSSLLKLSTDSLPHSSQTSRNRISEERDPNTQHPCSWPPPSPARPSPHAWLTYLPAPKPTKENTHRNNFQFVAPSFSYQARPAISSYKRVLEMDTENVLKTRYNNDERGVAREPR